METFTQKELAAASFEAKTQSFTPLINEETERRARELKKRYQVISELQERVLAEFEAGSLKTVELPTKADAEVEHDETTEEKIAYEILCTVLDKLNSDIRELTNRLKLSLDRLDALEATRGINDKNY